MHPVSALILTKDEAINIEACLDCLRFSDDVVVYDSYSSDETVELAKKYDNVRVVQRKFDNWSTHQNWCMENIEFKHPWVLYVDADERVEDDLAREVQEKADPDSEFAAFQLRRKDMFMGKWLKRAQLYPTWIVRMFRPKNIRYERLVNPIAIVDGKTGDLDGHLIHYPFSKGIDHWFARHNQYSGMEAEELLKVQANRNIPFGDLFGDASARRAALKNIFFRLPIRPHIKWFYYMFWRMAWLDGSAGRSYARLIYLYEYMISMKVKAIVHQRSGKEL
ncbi:MAG: glycosyltransferase family 2 protein [Planctomycetota bacterium]